MSWRKADVYRAAFSVPAQPVTLPRGVDRPAGPAAIDIGLLATTTSLLTREADHPALRQLFAQAAQRHPRPMPAG